MLVDRRTFLEVAGLAALGGPAAATRAGHTFEAEGAGKTLRDAAGRVVLGYLTRKPEGVPLAGNSACCIHPLNTPGGEPVTDLAPADHRDHRGIFFAWHNVEFTRGGESHRGDFWGWGRFAPTEGRDIVNRDLRLVQADERSAQIAVRNDWRIEGRPVMEEAVTIRTALEEGARVVDLTFRLGSEYDVTVNRMAFTGFCFRCRKEGDYTFGDSHGEVTLPNSRATDPDSNWPPRAWYCHTVALTTGRTISAAVIDHPQNPESSWHGARGVSFLNPCIAAARAVVIPARHPLVLRYRAAVIDGKFPDGLLDRMADRVARAAA
jgi:hypothetical protein